MSNGCSSNRNRQAEVPRADLRMVDLRMADRRAEGAAVAEAVGVKQMAEVRDRVGLSWRPELAAGILTNLDCIDVLEVIADDYFESSATKLRSLRTLSGQAPVLLHGIAQGLASMVAGDTRRLDKLARVVSAVEPESWSEHLSFVRGGGREIGHLAAPPLNRNTVEETCRKYRAGAQDRGVGAHDGEYCDVDRPAEERSQRSRLDRANHRGIGLRAAA